MQKQWHLKSRPKLAPSLDNFELVHAPIPKLESGKALVKVLYLGVAPVMLRYMRNETDFEQTLGIGDLMPGRGVGQVIVSDCKELPEGAFVQARLGWQEYALIDGNQNPRPFVLDHTDLPLSYGISTLALSGFTGLVGLREIGLVKPEDHVLVSGAAGGVGSQVAMIAKALGVKNITGIAGGPGKCQIMTEVLGYDQALDYKTTNLEEQIDGAFPDGIDVFFDNVGGALLDSVLARLRRRARIVICGGISEYLLPPAQKHKFAHLQNLGRQDAKMEAFFIYDYQSHFGSYAAELADWIRAGLIQPLEDISEGIETLPQALIDLYAGQNLGVRMARVGVPE